MPAWRHTLAAQSVAVGLLVAFWALPASAQFDARWCAPLGGWATETQAWCGVSERCDLVGVSRPDFPRRYVFGRATLVDLKAKLAGLKSSFVPAALVDGDMIGHLNAVGPYSLTYTSAVQLAAAAGAPTNWFDATPWASLNTHSNGWRFLPAVLDALTIKAGTSYQTNNAEWHGDYGGYNFADTLMHAKYAYAPGVAQGDRASTAMRFLSVGVEYYTVDLDARYWEQTVPTSGVPRVAIIYAQCLPQHIEPWIGGVATNYVWTFNYDNGPFSMTNWNHVFTSAAGTDIVSLAVGDPDGVLPVDPTAPTVDQIAYSYGWHWQGLPLTLFRYTGCKWHN